MADTEYQAAQRASFTDKAPRPVAGPATGAALKANLKAALAVPTGPEGVAAPPAASSPPSPPDAPTGAGGAARESTIMKQVQEAQDGAHSVGDPNKASNAGKTSQSSDHWNSY